jgi:hypothetical protein
VELPKLNGLGFSLTIMRYSGFIVRPKSDVSFVHTLDGQFSLVRGFPMPDSVFFIATDSAEGTCLQCAPWIGI